MKPNGFENQVCFFKFVWLSVVLVWMRTACEVEATLDVLVDALGALSCGCGCRFYEVGTCETRFTTECEVMADREQFSQ